MPASIPLTGALVVAELALLWLPGDPDFGSSRVGLIMSVMAALVYYAYVARRSRSAQVILMGFFGLVGTLTLVFGVPGWGADYALHVLITFGGLVSLTLPSARSWIADER